ncbi:DNA polymerase IV [Vibrio inusitatus NBRC 102082]|uniref:DNA polymerase IV n=1 Tax=Vibrio inusitatus NBRC 102082 TaxID=1219070 RepID=A0A4Y3HVV6_9VIBR|nr:DNA polymerase IV [Vibrio inusitatus]GEA51168.1 DNA polymerase IV [Vibrio inusitatus NBRC 102082]
MTKKIIHVDLDCYYAAVEARDDPTLRGIPLAIGGSQYGRGVLSTCNYEAREFGVKSAMPTARALKLCPNLTVIPGNMEKYKLVSKQIQAIFSRYTDVIEPLSLDEAYLDVSDSNLFKGSATLIAEDIRKAIESELQLTASAGVAPIKFVAKVASDINKPNGICVITPEQIESFVEELDLGKIPGVGKVTKEKLNKLGLFTGKDVKAYDQRLLLKQFGKFGQSLWEKCHGVDKRNIETSRVRKSVGVEKTFNSDIHTEAECHNAIAHLYPSLLSRLERASSDKKIIKQGVKLKFNDFKQTTVEHKKRTLDKLFFNELLEEALKRQNGRGIRLIGLSVGLDTEKSNKEQISFKW